MIFRLGYAYMNTVVSWNILLEIHCNFSFWNSKKKGFAHFDKNQYKKNNICLFKIFSDRSSACLNIKLNKSQPGQIYDL